MKPWIITFLLVVSTCLSASDELPAMKIEPLEPGVYLHKSYSMVDGFGLVSSNGLVVVREQSAFIVDTPWSIQDTMALVDWIKQQNLNLLGSVSTHSHDDRTAGIPWLNDQGIPTYASVLTNQFLTAEGKTAAQHEFNGDAFQWLDGQIEVYHPGGGHTPDNVVVWLPETKTLFGGCLVRSLEAKGMGYTGEAVLSQWPNSIQKLLMRYPEIKTVIPGHGKVGDKRLLQHTQKLAQLSVEKNAAD